MTTYKVEKPVHIDIVEADMHEFHGGTLAFYNLVDGGPELVCAYSPSNWLKVTT